MTTDTSINELCEAADGRQEKARPMKHSLARIASLLMVLVLCALAPADKADEGNKGQVEPLKSDDLSAWKEPTGTWAIVGGVSVPGDHPEQLQPDKGTGVLLNNPKGPTVDLLTRKQFGDIELHLEFLIPRHSNSGVYFMGRYELQIYDSFGVEKDRYPGIECGGIYPRWVNEHNEGGHSPKVNASLPPGQWQSFDVTFRAPRFDAKGTKTANAVFVKVVHNGKVIHENVEVTGPTRAASFNDEKATGPIMLQGDHGPVAFRNIRIRALGEGQK